MENSLKGSVSLVIGATEGMGRATAFYLSGLGANVALGARRIEALNSIADELRQRFRTDPLALSIDVRIDNDVEMAIEEIIKRYGRIDSIVNFAGNPEGFASGERKKPIYEQSIAHMKEIAEVDHFGSVRVLKYAIPHMIMQKSGVIILISSTASVYGYSENVDYIPYKGANEALAKTTALRSEREGWGIRLYTVAPGDTFTPSTWNSYSPEERRESAEYGLILPESVAKVISWLFSGRLRERYEMKVDLDTGVVADEGRNVPLKNGDVVVVDAKTLPKIFSSMGEGFTLFSPSFM